MKNIDQSNLPAPYNGSIFERHRRGISDDPGIDVFVDRDKEFAVLHPQPLLNYSHYVPRQTKLQLGAYKKTLDVVPRRFAKIADLFPAQGTILEVGAAAGEFLAKLRAERPSLDLVAIEPDRDTAAARTLLKLAGDYVDLDAAAADGVQADIVCLFHVFEHIVDTKGFLAAIRRVLKPGGKVIIEVPSLDDPLLTLYRCEAYAAFYFQRQHPFVYSGRSLKRVIEVNRLQVLEIRPYQRYGLENHLTWLTEGRAGGDPVLRELLGGMEPDYRSAMERSGKTDTIFAVAVAQ
jgi:SAM-dependent methyltransferase